MAKILYISLTGMTESLGESQVVQYLLELVKHHTIFLLSFEKPVNKEKYKQMQEVLDKANIKWKYYEYSNRYGMLSTAIQMILAILFVSKWIRKERIQVIHARSLIPALIGVFIKKIFNVKLLFDIRGFAIDEKIMDGRLKPDSLLTRFMKKVEANVYKNSDHVVTLTHASKPIIEEKYAVKARDITVIPTCANVELFKPIPLTEKIALKRTMGFDEDDYIILRNGSLNSSYDFDGELKLFAELAMLDDKIKFLFLNQGQHKHIKATLEKYKIDKNRYEIHAVDFDQVSRYLHLADLLIFLVNPTFAKQASLPTKFAEVVSCHLYSVTTRYGDMEYYFNGHRIGVLLDLDEVHGETKKTAIKILNFIEKSQNSQFEKEQDFKTLFSQHFSREIAVERYQRIYDDLIK